MAAKRKKVARRKAAKKAAPSRLGQAMRKAKRTAKRKPRARQAPKRRPAVRLLYVKTRSKRIRFKVGDAWSPQSYANRGAARRAARRQYGKFQAIRTRNGVPLT